MSLNDISENAEGLSKSAQNFVDKNIEYYKLSAFKKVAKGINSLVLFIVIGAILFGAMLLLTVAAALFLGTWLDNLGLGFLILGGCYLLIALIVYYGFREVIERSVLIKTSQDLFDGE